MSRETEGRVTMKDTSKAAGVAGAGLVLIALFVANYYPEQQAVLWILAIAGGACLLFFFIAERHLLARTPGSRAARHGANAAAITLAFLGILVILNVLASRHNEKLDLTENRSFTLSDQTVKVLEDLKTDVSVTAFFSDGSETQAEMKRLLDDFADESPKLKVAFVDPDKNPAQANQYGIREYGTTVFESGDQSYRITETTEEAATNALVRVTREGKKTLYFLTGHGEHGLDDTQRSGYSTAKGSLEDQGYAVKELLLLRDATVPDDADVLVVAGPTKPFLEEELEVLQGYLQEGGRAVFLLDPQVNTGLEGFLRNWGVVARDDVIIDTMSRLFGGSYTTPILTEYPAHEITRDFKLATFLPFARSLDQVQPPPEGLSYTVLARTTQQSWGETDLSNDRASFEPTADFKGPLTAAVLVEQTGEGQKGRFVVVGDSDFADNTYFGFSGNGDFFQNLVSYLAEEEDLISIRPKDAKPTPLMLTRAQGATLFYGSVVMVPAILLVAGLGIWWKRRNL